MAIERIVRLAVDGLAAGFQVDLARGFDRIHEAGAVVIVGHLAEGEGAPELGALIGRAAAVRVAVGDGDERTVFGVVDDVERRPSEVRLTIVPRIAPLGDAVDHRVFLGKDAIAIARAVLEEHGVDVAARVGRTLTARPQCVQVFESDASFASRILADEGVAWHVEHTSGKDVVVLADGPPAYAAISGDETLRFAPDAGLGSGECVFDVRLTRATTPDAVQLRDYYFEHPLVDQYAEAKAGPGAIPIAEVPGGYRDPVQGNLIAGLRLEEARARRTVLHGRSTCRRLAAGLTFRLEGCPRRELDGRWLLVEVEWIARDGAASEGGEQRFEASFSAVAADVPYRPLRRPAPTLGGVQTATVTGPAGAEIHTNSHGQVSALLRWDRRRPKDETSSTWLRALQPQVAGGLFLPRVGWEVLLGFSGPSADTPYVLGRLDNGAAPPAEGLPAHKVRSAFGSRTTPGGAGANVLRTDDAAGREDMLVNASRDLNERTESDKTIMVNAADTHSIGGSRTHIVGQDHALKVDAAQSTTIGGSRSVNVGAGMDLTLGSESVSVGGARLFEIGGDYSTDVKGTLSRAVGAAKIETAIAAHNRHVSGSAVVQVGGDWNEVGGVASAVGVAGAHLRAIAGPISVRAPSCTIKATGLAETFGSYTATAGGFVQEKLKAAAALSVGGSGTVKGSKVIFKAKASLTVEAAGMSIRLTPSSIEVKGPFESGVETKVTGTDKSEG